MATSLIPSTKWNCFVIYIIINFSLVGGCGGFMPRELDWCYHHWLWLYLQTGNIMFCSKLWANKTCPVKILSDFWIQTSAHSKATHNTYYWALPLQSVESWDRCDIAGAHRRYPPVTPGVTGEHRRCTLANGACNTGCYRRIGAHWWCHLHLICTWLHSDWLQQISWPLIGPPVIPTFHGLSM